MRSGPGTKNRTAIAATHADVHVRTRAEALLARQVGDEHTMVVWRQQHRQAASSTLRSCITTCPMPKPARR